MIPIWQQSLDAWRHHCATDPKRALRELANPKHFGGQAGFEWIRRQIESDVRALWLRFSKEEPAVALRYVEVLSPAQRDSLPRVIAGLWEHVADGSALAGLRALSMLRASERRLLGTGLEDLWRRIEQEDGAQPAIGALRHLPATERAALRGEIATAWRKLAKADVRAAFGLLGELDVAEREQVEADIDGLWPEWASVDPGGALLRLRALRPAQRIQVSSLVPGVWRALAKDSPRDAIGVSSHLLASERVALTQDVADAWRRLGSEAPEQLLSASTQNELPVSVHVQLVDAIQDAWRRDVRTPATRLRLLHGLPPEVRAGLREDVAPLWRRLAEADLQDALRVLLSLSVEEAISLPSPGAVHAFESGGALPEGTTAEVLEDVRRLWRYHAPEQALEWLASAKPALRDVIAAAERTEVWIRCMQEAPKAALAWLKSVPKKLHPRLTQEQLVLLLQSEKAEARLWAISQTGAEAKRSGTTAAARPRAPSENPPARRAR
jgi:hypothetical protein